MESSCSPQKYFLSVGTGPYSAVTKRIGNSAEELGIFNNVTIMTELPSLWREECPDHPMGGRGDGYWFWKPRAILDVMDRMSHGDILVYCDAGCVLRPSEEWDYFFAKLFGKDALIFQLYHPEHRFTKGDIIKEFDLVLDSEEVKSFMMVGGINMWVKNERTLAFLKEWSRLCSICHLIDDSVSIAPNSPEFVDNRHDQSILSLLIKTWSKKGKIDPVIIPDKTYPNRGSFQAIFAARQK